LHRHPPVRGGAVRAVLPRLRAGVRGAGRAPALGEAALAGRGVAGTGVSPVHRLPGAAGPARPGPDVHQPLPRPGARPRPRLTGSGESTTSCGRVRVAPSARDGLTDLRPGPTIPRARQSTRLNSSHAK